MLRRTKTSTRDGRQIVNIPALTEEIVYIELNEEEKATYDRLHSRSQQNYREQLSQNNYEYLSIFEQILRLRQFCDHPDLVTPKNYDLNDKSLSAFMNKI
mmetsp:Transcript_3619/g.481  ORF Transcript_3619/g.481 Transcript_3619/m.481 type:complete len:100 (-) Transcript_3619:783-1082(-)